MSEALRFSAPGLGDRRDELVRRLGLPGAGARRVDADTLEFDHARVWMGELTRSELERATGLPVRLEGAAE